MDDPVGPLSLPAGEPIARPIVRCGSRLVERCVPGRASPDVPPSEQALARRDMRRLGPDAPGSEHSLPLGRHERLVRCPLEPRLPVSLRQVQPTGSYRSPLRALPVPTHFCAVEATDR